MSCSKPVQEFDDENESKEVAFQAAIAAVNQAASEQELDERVGSALSSLDGSVLLLPLCSSLYWCVAVCVAVGHLNRTAVTCITCCVLSINSQDCKSVVHAVYCNIYSTCFPKQAGVCAHTHNMLFMALTMPAASAQGHCICCKAVVFPALQFKFSQQGQQSCLQYHPASSVQLSDSTPSCCIA